MRSFVALILLAASSLVAARQRPESAVEIALRAFWTADTPDRVADSTTTVLATGGGYDELADRLKRGREYGRRPTGKIDLPSRDRGIALDNVVEVPAEFDPHVRGRCG